MAQIKVILLPCGCNLKYHILGGLIYKILHFVDTHSTWHLLNYIQNTAFGFRTLHGRRENSHAAEAECQK